ncbi:kinase-like domain-containing protein, partial [Lentinula lateritia]
RRMDLVDLDMVKLINTGGSGKVYLVRDNIDRQHLALKVIPKSRNVFHCNRTKVTTEKNIHSFLTMESDAFFLPLVATWSDRENYYLASEYIPGGDLALRIMQQRTFDEVEARFYIAELIVALERLHTRKIIHRDIKPSNILIRPDGHIVLADFGVSKRFSDPSEDSDESFYTDSDDSSNSNTSAFMTSDDCGTPYFMSPEQHRGDRYSFEVDYWAMGVILYRMVTGKMPFGDSAMNKGQIARSVLEDDVSFIGHSSTISMVTQDFILGLLAKDPCHRLHPSQIRKDPFFYGIDWSLVENRDLAAPWRPYVAPIPKQSR